MYQHQCFFPEHFTCYPSLKYCIIFTNLSSEKAKRIIISVSPIKLFLLSRIRTAVFMLLFKRDETRISWTGMFQTFLRKNTQPKPQHTLLSWYAQKMHLKLWNTFLNSFKSFNYKLFKQVKDICPSIIFQVSNKFNNLCLDYRFWPRIPIQISVWQLFNFRIQVYQLKKKKFLSAG